MLAKHPIRPRKSIYFPWLVVLTSLTLFVCVILVALSVAPLSISASIVPVTVQERAARADCIIIGTVTEARVGDKMPVYRITQVRVESVIKRDQSLKGTSISVAVLAGGDVVVWPPSPVQPGEVGAMSLYYLNVGDETQTTTYSGMPLYLPPDGPKIIADANFSLTIHQILEISEGNTGNFSPPEPEKNLEDLVATARYIFVGTVTDQDNEYRLGAQDTPLGWQVFPDMTLSTLTIERVIKGEFDLATARILTTTGPLDHPEDWIWEMPGWTFQTGFWCF